MYRCKGTITVFLSLISMLFLSLFCTMAESARVQAARVQAAAAFDMGLFSVFGEYDSVLLEEYDIWFFDAARQAGRFSKDILETTLSGYISPNIHVTDGISAAKIWNLFPTEMEVCLVDKYALATDGGGQVFYRQAVENEKELFAGNTASALRKSINEIKQQEKKGEQYIKEEQTAEESLQSALEEQRRLLEEGKRAGQGQQEQGAQRAGSKGEGGLGAPAGGTGVQGKAENPLESIKKLKKLGILSMVMKDVSKISDKRLKINDLPSNRVLHKGNLKVKGGSTGAFSQLVFLEYLKNHFTCAAAEKQEKGRVHALSYELEYIAAGKRSDMENLKKVANKLLLLREGANYACIMGSTAMREEAMALAAAIAGAAAVPPLAAALQKAIMLAWAYGESILDVRTLLSGGRVPLTKTEAEWKLSLGSLGRLTEVLDECDRGEGRGQSYEEYLAGILALEQQKKRNLRALDLIEANRRMEKGGEGFRADALVAQMEAYAAFELAPVFLAVPSVWMQITNQGTAYSIKGQYGYMEGGV